jgi:hypothetical protein
MTAVGPVRLGTSKLIVSAFDCRDRSPAGWWPAKPVSFPAIEAAQGDLTEMQGEQFSFSSWKVVVLQWFARTARCSMSREKLSGVSAKSREGKVAKSSLH